MAETEQSAPPKKRAPKKSASGKSKDKSGAKRAGGAIAITGASGFWGSSLLAQLRTETEFERVVVLDVNKPTLPIRKTRFYKTDLTEPNCDARIADILEKEGVRQVVHLAGFSNPQRNNAYAHEFEVIGTLHLLHACAQKQIEKFVTLTSTLVYGARPDNPNFLTETMPLQAKKSFTHVANKVEIEELLAKFAQKEKTQVTVLRPCMTLGPRRRNYVTRFFSRSAIPTVMGYDPLLQFVHENDVLDALTRVVENDHPGVFNIVGEGVLPLSTLLKIGGKWSVPTPSFSLYPAVGAAWIAGASEIPPQFLDYIRYLCIADGEKAKEQLKWSPRFSTKDTWLNFTGEERVRRYR